MRSPLTANDDQPGPTGRRQSSAGGALDQSVAILTPRTPSSRSGPRKPGHSAGFVFTIGGGAAGSDFAGATSADLLDAVRTGAAVPGVGTGAATVAIGAAGTAAGSSLT